MAKKKDEAVVEETSTIKAVAKELNDLLGLDPAINIDQPDADVEIEIKQNACEIVPADEKQFKAETWVWLHDGGYLKHFVKIEVAKPEAKPKAEKKAAAPKAEKAAPKEKAPAAPKAEKKAEPTAPKAEKTVVVRKAANPDAAKRKEFLGGLIDAGKYTRKELIAKFTAEFPEANASTLTTLITDSKNPKYTAFPVPANVDENGIYSFPK